MDDKPFTDNKSTKKQAFCSFCKKSHRVTGPLVEGPGGVHICSECIELCRSILEQEKKRHQVPQTAMMMERLTPRQIVARFDEYIIGATITPTPEEWNLHYKMNCHNLWYNDFRK